MAGAGYKLFNTGDVLTAAQVNTYLQEQVVMVFANAAARTTALSGVLAEGMVSYLKDTDALEIYSGTAWVGYGSGDITGITTGATSGLTGGVTSGTADLKLNTTAKGGLLVGTGSGTVTELSVGTNAQVLTADSTTASGLKWATAASTTPSFVGCSLWKSSGQSSSNATWTNITFDSEHFDTDSFHSTSSNTSRITIPSGKAGKYQVNAMVMWPANSTGSRLIKVQKNASDIMYGNWVGNAGSADPSAIQLAGVLDLAVSDYIELNAYQASGGSLTIDFSSTKTFFQVTYLGA